MIHNLLYYYIARRSIQESRPLFFLHAFLRISSVQRRRPESLLTVFVSSPHTTIIIRTRHFFSAIRHCTQHRVRFAAATRSGQRLRAHNASDVHACFRPRFAYKYITHTHTHIWVYTQARERWMYIILYVHCGHTPPSLPGLWISCTTNAFIHFKKQNSKTRKNIIM